MATPSDSVPATKQNPPPTLTGGCTCGTIRYHLTATPLYINCCHCRYCQRETGSAFVLNAIIEATHLSLLPSAIVTTKAVSPAQSDSLVADPVPLAVPTPSESGVPQLVSRCPRCFVALWSEYDGVSALKYVRVGTLDQPALCPPSIHIFTESKLPWVGLDGERKRGVKVCKTYYDREVEWPKESLERRGKIAGEIAKATAKALEALKL